MKPRISKPDKRAKKRVNLYLANDVMAMAKKMAALDRRSVSGLFEQLVVQEDERTSRNVV